MGGGDGNEEGCRPRAHARRGGGGAWTAAAATQKVAGPEPLQERRRREHWRHRQRKSCRARNHARSGGGEEPCGFNIAGPMPVEEDEGACFVTPVAGSASAPEEEEERARAVVATT